MTVNRLTLTYALLAHIKDTSSNESTSLMKLFVPVVKKAISDYFVEKECLKCENISDIKEQLQSTFSLEMPVPVLSNILKLIESEENDEKQFKVYGDGSCIIQDFHYTDLESIILEKEKELSLLQVDYQNYCSLCNIEYNFDKLEKFIRSQQIELFTNQCIDYTGIESEIPKYVELKLQSNDSQFYNTIANIFIGGIIADYITLKFECNVSNNTELLLDTNYITSLMDLNSEDAKNTCNDLFQICKSMGFKFSILEKTVDQIHILLNDRIANFQHRKLYYLHSPNDILAACVRRNLKKSDLEYVKDNLAKYLIKKNINTIYDAQTQKLLPKAKSNPSYKILAEKRHNTESALLDSLAEIYVREKRGNNISSFSDIKCWFLHNSTYVSNIEVDIKERWSISANELLTMLWLTNPAQQKDITSKQLTKSCLTAYISKFRKFKSSSTEKILLKELTERVNSLVNIEDVTEESLYLLTSRMVEGGISNDEVQDLINMNDDSFINKVNEFKRKYDQKFEHTSELTQSLAQLLNENDSLKEQNNCLVEKNQKDTESYKEEVLNLKNKLSDFEKKIKKYEDEHLNKKNEYIEEKVSLYCAYYKKWYRRFIALIVTLIASVIVYFIFENDIIEIISKISGCLSLLSSIGITIFSKVKKNIIESEEVKTGLKAILTLNFASILEKDKLLEEVKKYYSKQYDDEKNKLKE